MDKKKQTATRFDDFAIMPALAQALAKRNFVTPTPIQAQAIPVALSGRDVIGIAQTGTGKTLGFGIPLLQNILKTKTRGLILLPTRELALQVDAELQKIGAGMGLRTTVLMGGTAQNKQVRELKKDPHVVIATPGRLIDLIDQGYAQLDRMSTIVLDEADRMLDTGFLPQVKRIMAKIPKKRQIMLFSATMSDGVTDLSKQYLKDPARVEVAKANTTAQHIEQSLYMVPKPKKIDLLNTLLKEHKGTTIVFSRTKHGAKKIARQVNNMGHTAADIQGNRSLAQRTKALAGFKNGTYRVLVATDIASRGIDVKDISLVINFDLPDTKEDYVHRIGRTGRNGAKGKAISFATHDQKKDIKAIERLIKKQLPMVQLPELEEYVAPPLPEPQERHQQRGQGRGNGRGRRHHSGNKNRHKNRRSKQSRAKQPA